MDGGADASSDYVAAINEAPDISCAITLAEGLPPFERAAVLNTLVSSSSVTLATAAVVACLLRQLQTFEFSEKEHVRFVVGLVTLLEKSTDDADSLHLVAALNNIVLAGGAGRIVAEAGILCRLLPLRVACCRTSAALDLFFNRLACRSCEAARHIGRHCFPALVTRLKNACVGGSAQLPLLQLVYSALLRQTTPASDDIGSTFAVCPEFATWDALAGTVSECLQFTADLRVPSVRRRAASSPTSVDGSELESSFSVALNAALIVAVWPPPLMHLLCSRRAGAGVAAVALACLSGSAASAASIEVVLGSLRSIAETDAAARAEAVHIFLGGAPLFPASDASPSAALPGCVVAALQDTHSDSDSLRAALDETVFSLCDRDVGTFTKVCGVALAAGRLVSSASGSTSSLDA
jgi:hypothetical protein